MRKHHDFDKGRDFEKRRAYAANPRRCRCGHQLRLDPVETNLILCRCGAEYVYHGVLADCEQIREGHDD